MLLIVCGLQGTGKTYVSRRISELLGAELLRTDVIRKGMLREASYSGKEISDVYSEMFRMASLLLNNQRQTVLDATFSKAKYRHRAAKFARESGVGFEVILVTCREEVVKQRILQRSGDASEADFEVYLKCKPLFEQIFEKHTTIDNSGTPEETDKQIENLINQINASR